MPEPPARSTPPPQGRKRPPTPASGRGRAQRSRSAGRSLLPRVVYAFGGSVRRGSLPGSVSDRHGSALASTCACGPGNFVGAAPPIWREVPAGRQTRPGGGDAERRTCSTTDPRAENGSRTDTTSGRRSRPSPRRTAKWGASSERGRHAGRSEPAERTRALPARGEGSPRPAPRG